MSHFLMAATTVALIALLAGTAGSEPPSSADLAGLSDFAEVTREGIVFVKIPAGQFTMGTTDAQRDELKAAGFWSPLQEDERPARRVRITRPFLLGKFEVTQKQWVDVIGKDPPGANNRERNAIRDPSAFKGENHPVESVSWDDVQAYLERLNRQGGGGYRLPTEAEWEYAARAGGSGLYGQGAFGAAITVATLTEHAWLRDNAENQTHPVGERKPNAWGLHDMLGNVWEWCRDYYDARYYANGPSADPVNTLESTERVFRGGSWFLEAHQVRASIRGGHLPTSRMQYFGFRVARDL